MTLIDQLLGKDEFIRKLDLMPKECAEITVQLGKEAVPTFLVCRVDGETIKVKEKGNEQTLFAIKIHKRAMTEHDF